MNTAENKQLMQAIFDELANGNGQPFVDAMAENFCWRIIGSTEWSGDYQGKQDVLDNLFAPLIAQFQDQYRNKVTRLIAENDFVVAECRGQVTTKRGKPYNNTYCWVCRFSDGKLVELIEYMDTDLVNTALESPQRKAAIV